MSEADPGARTPRRSELGQRGHQALDAQSRQQEPRQGSWGVGRQAPVRGSASLPPDSSGGLNSIPPSRLHPRCFLHDSPRPPPPEPLPRCSGPAAFIQGPLQVTHPVCSIHVTNLRHPSPRLGTSRNPAIPSSSPPPGPPSPLPAPPPTPPRRPPSVASRVPSSSPPGALASGSKPHLDPLQLLEDVFPPPPRRPLPPGSPRAAAAAPGPAVPLRFRAGRHFHPLPPLPEQPVPWPRPLRFLIGRSSSQRPAGWVTTGVPGLFPLRLSIKAISAFGW